jgi:hypothetical protein
MKHPFIGPIVFAGLLAGAAGPARADVLRYHYTPADVTGHVALKPGPLATPGEWQPFRGSSRREPYLKPLQPTQLVTFRHPYTGGLVTVPLALPDDTPRIEHVRDRIVFNYGSYTVAVQFFPDGSVDAIYNSGPFRPI